VLLIDGATVLPADDETGDVLSLRYEDGTVRVEGGPEE